MPDQQKQQVQPPQATPEELTRLAQAEKLDEADFLRVRLLNKNIELFEMQIELSKSRMREAYAVMQEFGANLVQRYGLKDVAQVDPNKGTINRNTMASVDDTNG